MKSETFFTTYHFMFNGILLGGGLMLTSWILNLSSESFLMVVVTYHLVLGVFVFVLLSDNYLKSGDKYVKKHMMFYVILWVFVEWVFIFNICVEPELLDKISFFILFMISHMFLSYCEKLSMKPYSSSSFSGKVKSKI